MISLWPSGEEFEAIEEKEAVGPIALRGGELDTKRSQTVMAEAKGEVRNLGIVDEGGVQPGRAQRSGLD